MIATMLLAGGVMVGAGISSGVGEEAKPAPSVMAHVEAQHLRLEGWASTVKKIETHQGYLVRASADLYNVGIGVSHREAGKWQKTILWGRLSAQKGILRGVGKVALNGPNHEYQLEAQLRLSKWLEGRIWGEHFTQTNGIGSGNGMGVELFVGK